MIKNLRKKGFTIVELVIVIAVIAILAAILIPTFANVVNKANEAAIQAELKSSKTQYLAEAADDYNYNPDLELVFMHTNDKGIVVYYLEQDGTYVPATGENFNDETHLPLDASHVFIPLQYKSGTAEWLFAEFGSSTVGVIATATKPVESYGKFVNIIEISDDWNVAYGNDPAPIWKATDSGFEVEGELIFHDLAGENSDPAGFGAAIHWFLHFSIVKPENIVIGANTKITINDNIWHVSSPGDIIGEFSNGSFDLVKYITEDAKTLKVIVDWDGDGENDFLPKTYIIDLSKVTFGK